MLKNAMNSTLSRLQKKLFNDARRGNAEVEELVKPYVSQLINQQEAELFERFLQENDQHLFEWLLNPQQSPEKYTGLINRIRAHYLTC